MKLEILIIFYNTDYFSCWEEESGMKKENEPMKKDRKNKLGQSEG